MSASTHPDRLSLLGLRFEARHGVLPHEKEAPQPFEVDLVLHADLSVAAERDDLEATVDYAGLYGVVRDVVTGPSFDLIEALAGAIARAALSACDAALVGAVEVRVRKPHAPIEGATFDTVEVALLRRRSGA